MAHFHPKKRYNLSLLHLLLSFLCFLTHVFICRFMFNIVLQVFWFSVVYSFFIGLWKRNPNLCLQRGSPLFLFHLCFALFSLLSFTFHFYFQHLSMQEPTLLSYRQKGAILSPVARRNPYYKWYVEELRESQDVMWTSKDNSYV